MKAVRIHEYGGPEKLQYEDGVSEPQVSADTVLIAAAAASVNPIDWKIRSGARQKDFPLTLPAILGRDVSGLVRSVGANVNHFKPGDRVFALANATYAELVAVPASDVSHIPHGLELEDAAALPLVALTGEQLVRLAAKVQPGQTVLVTGALGSVGRCACHAAMKIGAKVIAGVRRSQFGEAASLRTAGLVALDEDEDLARLPLLDAVADTVGGPVATKIMPHVRQGGTYGYASVLLEGTQAINPTVTITRVFAKPDPSKVSEFAEDWRDGKLVLPIGHRLPLREAAQGHVLGERGGSGKILLLTRETS